MKTIGLILTGFLLMHSLAYAGPERVKLKSEERQMKEESVRGHTKKISLSKVQDPETRKALAEILNYLDLPIKKR